MSPRIYRFVVRYDSGTAPNPFGGWCSLAICKPAIRRSAQIGDWIVGLRSRQPDHVIYAMQVEDAFSMDRYWDDARFRAKRPDACASADNIYRPVARGHLEQVLNRAHGPGDVERDLSGRRVLVGRRFWYFGDQCPALPTDLIHLVHESQGHSVDAGRRPDDDHRLRAWLAHWAIGIHGSPIDSLRLQPIGSPDEPSPSSILPATASRLPRCSAMPKPPRGCA